MNQKDIKLRTLKKIITFTVLIAVLFSCKNNKIEETSTDGLTKGKVIEEFGFNLNDYKVIHDTIKSGETFGEILDRHHVKYPKILEIINNTKDSFNIRKIRIGVPYTILAKKDSTEQAQVFIYEHSKIRHTIVDFKDSIPVAYTHKKAVRTEMKTASGIITTSLSETIENQELSPLLTFKMADDIYAWTIDFSRLLENDKFKLIYEQFYINDTVPVGIGEIKAAYFEHGGKSFYAFRYVVDSALKTSDYFDEQGVNLRRQFLKMPVKFGRLSSRYNLRRRIAYYGNKIKPHKGTDFAAPVGTKIYATANGVVIESRRKGGNGNYVKIRHNSTYTTQYLHMSRRAVKVGDVVKQGDVIGYVGMTGNTSGPHVCYRFWKNGVQVDPLKQKLPAAKPIKESLKPDYIKFIAPIKKQLDSLEYPIQNNL